jgi:thiopurine S-methyltransferase
MEESFWRERWEKREIPFHEGAVNGLLVKHFGELGLGVGARVFVPLCGKTLAMGWLLGQGFRVVGAELHEGAVGELFGELGVVAEVEVVGSLKRYRAEGLEVFVGDFFQVSRDVLGGVDGVFDRAALVAMPAGMRDGYARHLVEISGGARQLLITFVYDQSKEDGPPFSVEEGEVRRLYGKEFAVRRVDSVEVAGGLKGRVEALEEVWVLGVVGEER